MAFEVFISYAHEDKIYKDQLTRHLSNMRNQQLITAWHDGDILPGTEWKKQILDHLASAQIILLLISSDFMASKFCYSIEMKQAIERHDKNDARVIPILLRKCDREGAPFEKLLVLPTDAVPIANWPSQDDAFDDVVKGIRKAISGLKASAAQNP